MGKSRSAVKGKSQDRRFYTGTVEFVRNVRGELRKVNWPNRDQLQQSTAVVLIIVLVLTAFVWFWDTIFQYLSGIVFL